MSNIPVLKPQAVVRILENLGFVEVRQKGSHKQFRHEDGRGTTVPFHQGRDISPTLLRKIAFDSEGRLVRIDIDRASQSVDLTRFETESLPMNSVILTK